MGLTRHEAGLQSFLRRLQVRLLRMPIYRRVIGYYRPFLGPTIVGVVLNLALGDWLAPLTPIVRTFVLATIAVPIVIYGLMPHLHRLRGRLLTRIVSS